MFPALQRSSFWLAHRATLKIVHHGSFSLKILNFVICDLCSFSPSLTILVPSWFVIALPVFFYFTKLIFCFLFTIQVDLLHSKSFLLWSSFQLSIEIDPGLLWFYFALLCDWSRKLAPPPQPIGCKIKTSHLGHQLFPALQQVACFYL